MVSPTTKVEKAPSVASTALAIEGGVPVRTTRFAPWPHYQEHEIEASAAVLRSGRINYWTGTEGREFEREHAAFTGTKYAIALANGTVALELALLALGIQPGDEVITTSRTFIASASCAAVHGMVPVLADVDRESQNVTSETIRAVLTPRTKAIVAVHLAGWPCDMDSIMSIAAEHGLKVIEDCAQANGATYKGRQVGSMGHVGAFSFCQDKIMSTAGEGGMITTNDDGVWELAWSYKDHGKSFDAVYNRQHGPGFRWLHESFGTNWRMTEVQSALGRVLLRDLGNRVEERRKLASMLTAGFAEMPELRVTVPPTEVRHAYYKYYVFLRPERLRNGWNNVRISEAITKEGVPCFTGSCSEIYLEKAFPETLRPKSRLPIARELGETSLMFLVHTGLTPTDMNDTLDAVRKVLRAAAR